jgi:hypothetical protein
LGHCRDFCEEKKKIFIEVGEYRIVVLHRGPREKQLERQYNYKTEKMTSFEKPVYYKTNINGEIRGEVSCERLVGPNGHLPRFHNHYSRTNFLLLFFPSIYNKLCHECIFAILMYFLKKKKKKERKKKGGSRVVEKIPSTCNLRIL